MVFILEITCFQGEKTVIFGQELFKNRLLVKVKAKDWKSVGIIYT